MITSVCDLHLDSYVIEPLDADPIDGNQAQYEAEFAVIAKKGVITQAFVSDMMIEYTNNGGYLRFAGRRRKVDDLDFSYMLIRATINAHEL